MRVLVTFAVSAEFAPWRSRHPFVPYEFDDSTQKREFDFYRANVGVHEITVLLTGMGRENAIRSMSTIPLETYDVCISTGLAGALDPHLKIGQIVASPVAVTRDRRLKAESDTGLVSCAVACGAHAVSAFLTSETIVATADEKELLAASASVVEMETSHILAFARERHVPVVAVRAISDAADEDLPVDFARILDSRGHVKVGGLLKELALHPHRILLLAQFGRQSRSAASSLADFLDEYIPAIGRQWHCSSSDKFEEVSAT